MLLPSKRTCHFRSQRGSAWSLGTPLGHLFSLCRCKWESATYFSVGLEAGGLDSLFLGTRSSALCVHPSPTIGLLSFLLYRHPLPRRLLPGNAKCISTLTSLPSARIEISLLPPSLPPHLQGTLFWTLANLRRLPLGFVWGWLVGSAGGRRPWVERPAVMLLTSTGSTAPCRVLTSRRWRPSFQAWLLLDGLLSCGHCGLGSGQVELIPPLSCH